MLVAGKVLARLTNYPKFALRSDIISYFEGCNLKAEDVEFVYDDNYRPRFMYGVVETFCNFVSPSIYFVSGDSYVPTMRFVGVQTLGI